ncbi:lipopolysaccharide biosynthesis protein [Adhaeribacter aquaticus]|uniref:lipopolysaccharide biosynthesis protein n=1 Tax=Adhaeribacter aquaticus TaxID=299567 RepID=UPI0003FCD9CF|nr:hypothetical protein [Adhaeribacter aquaticus]
MKTLTKSININWNNTKINEWSKLIFITGSGQLLVQAVGFICGILIIRLLPTQEYALYTIANTMLGTMTMLADSGISNGIMAEGGKVWQDKKKLGVVLATGLSLRKRFGIYTLLVTVPVLAYLLLDHGASWLTTGLIILALIPAFFAALSDSFLEMAPKLHQDIRPLQKNGVEVSLGRLALSALFLFIFPFTFLALIANSLPRIYGNYKLGKISARFASKEEKPDPVVEQQVIRAVKRTMPVIIYHCISGQIAIWLISFLGTTNSISELGALGRLSMVFNLFAILFSTIVVPRFSRMNGSKKALLRPYLFVQISTLLISGVIIFFIWLLSKQILWVFGDKYSGLSYELLLTGIAGCIGLMSGVCSQMVVSRGWFMNTYILIAIYFSSTVISLAFFNISSLIGVLYYNIVITLITYLLVFFYGLISINKTARTAPVHQE